MNIQGSPTSIELFGLQGSSGNSPDLFENQRGSPDKEQQYTTPSKKRPCFRSPKCSTGYRNELISPLSAAISNSVQGVYCTQEVHTCICKTTQFKDTYVTCQSSLQFYNLNSWFKLLSSLQSYIWSIFLREHNNLATWSMNYTVSTHSQISFKLLCVNELAVLCDYQMNTTSDKRTRQQFPKWCLENT